MNIDLRPRHHIGPGLIRQIILFLALLLHKLLYLVLHCEITLSVLLGLICRIQKAISCVMGLVVLHHTRLLPVVQR